jgi:hypothetical protein
VEFTKGHSQGTRALGRSASLSALPGRVNARARLSATRFDHSRRNQAKS